MALAQDLFEGFANATGDTGTVNRIEKQKADRVATQHEELAAQTQSILSDVTGLQQKRASLDPKHPNYQQDLAANDKALHDARQTLQDLYHPEQNPGALAHLGGFIRQHLSKNASPKTPGAIKQDMASRIAGLDAAAVTPASATPAATRTDPESILLTPEERHQAALVKAGLAPKAVAPKPPATPKPPAASNSKFSQEAAVYENHWGKKIKDWSPEQLTYFNKKMAYDAHVNHESTTTKLEKDEFGHVVPVQVTTESGPAGAPTEPGVPKTAGEAKSRLQRPGGSGVKVGTPLPITAATPAITKAQTDFQEATKLASVADQVVKRPDDAVNQKRLAVALERASAGRFTTQALDYIIKAGWGNTIEQWANNPTTGALPSDVLRQLVDGAHQNLQGAKDALAAAHGPAAGGGAKTIKMRAPNGQMKDVTPDQVDHYKSLGATVVQ